MDDVKEKEHENKPDDDAGIEQQKNEDRGIPQVFAHRGRHPFGQRMKHFRAMWGYSQVRMYLFGSFITLSAPPQLILSEFFS